MLPVSRPGVPLAIILGSRPGAMERKPNCTAKCSDDLSEDGCKPVWTGDAEVGVVFAQKRARLFPLLLYHLLSTRTLPFWAIFLAFFPLYSGGSDARLSHPR